MSSGFLGSTTSAVSVAVVFVSISGWSSGTRKPGGSDLTASTRRSLTVVMSSRSPQPPSASATTLSFMRALFTSRLPSEDATQAEDRQERNAAHGLRAAAAVVVDRELGVLRVVDVLHVEVGAELPGVEGPRALDAHVELVEGGPARRVRRALLARVDAGVGVVRTFRHGRVGRARHVPEARAEAPGAPGVAADEDE